MSSTGNYKFRQSIKPIKNALIINLVIVLISIFLYYKQNKSLDFYYVGFGLAYFAMLITNHYNDQIALLPRTPQYIYPSLALSYFIFQIYSYISKKDYDSMEYLRKGVWLIAFLGATFCSFYFFPKHVYIIFGLLCMLLPIIVNITLAKFMSRSQ